MALLNFLLFQYIKNIIIINIISKFYFLLIYMTDFICV